MNPREIFRRLIELREKLGLEEGTYNFSPILKRLEGEGVEISADQFTNKIRIADSYGSFLSDENGNLVIVHISDTRQSEEYLTDSTLERTHGYKGPKFHFSWCSTLERMVRENNYDKYVLSRNKDGLFTVQAKGYGKRKRLDNIKLYVCRNCLKQSYYNGYNQSSRGEQINIVRNFDIGKYIKETEKSIKEKGTTFRSIRKIPRYNDRTIPLNDYPDNWTDIAQGLKAENHYLCSRCGVDMIQKPEGLHVHHKNKHAFDNHPENLEVLCALCHKEHHPAMYVRPDIADFIRTART